MKPKSRKTSAKATDITAPKADTAEGLVIPKRAIMGQQATAPELDTDVPAREQIVPAAAPARKSIKPVTLQIKTEDDDEEVPAETSDTDTTPSSETEATPTTDVATEAPEAAAADTPTESTSPTEPTAPTTPSQAAPEAPADDEPATDADAAAKPTSKEDEQLAKTAEAVKRERELQEYIKNQKFFVPVNAAAQKRSIKVSFGLIVLVLVLGFVLIDLLLDTGAILLIQKIPHTHFFNLYR